MLFANAFKVLLILIYLTKCLCVSVQSLVLPPFVTKDCRTRPFVAILSVENWERG